MLDRIGRLLRRWMGPRGMTSPRLFLRRMLQRRFWQQAAALRRRADRLRRAGRFREALALYEAYLERRPDHAMGWSMMGHCLRALGREAEAEAAYVRAIARDPQDPYHRFVHGTFLLDHGQHRLAAQRLAEAAERGGRAAVRRLRLPGMRPAGDAAPGDAPVWIDVADLVEYVRHNRTLSGIQRVIAALAELALAEPGRATCVLTRPWDQRIWALPRAPLQQVLKLAEAGRGNTPEMHRLLDRLLRGAAPVMPRPGLRYLQPGGFWMHQGNPVLHLALRRSGAVSLALIHDLIPLSHPELCHPELVREFTICLGEELLGLHGAVANSRHTERSIRQTIAAHGLPERPVITVPLAHEMRPPLAAGSSQQECWTPAIAALRGQRFVLSVGTVEARKNHAFLVRLWARLRAEGVAVPPLVLAGKLGWNLLELEYALAEADGLDGLVQVIAGLSDGEIETLYAACLFTVQPSLIEGWGLPIGESLARGKLCVASNRGSMPEVGEGYALFFDPEDVEAALPLFRRLLGEPGFLEEAEARLRAGFRARRWPEVAQDILQACLRLGPPEGEAAAMVHPVLPPGLRFAPSPILGPDARPWPADPIAHPLRMILAEGWMRPGPRGAAMAERQAWLHLAAPVAGTLCLALAAERRVRVSALDRGVEIAPRGYAMLRLPLAAGAHSIRLLAEPEMDLPETLPWVRLISLELRPA
ncbi:MAG: glycosyltransferase [Rhodovarius sp.]|nr:glycosyltransferase [Rhodovarius sp.]MDW8315092.1 glycosyltransferase [Rhodovarius sp.]